MSLIFISHDSDDNVATRDLARRLEEQGYHSLFLDFDHEKGIKGGASWEQTLYAKLRACRAVIALCTRNSLKSHWCFAEIALARMEGKDVFTLLANPLEEEKPKLPSIMTIEQWIDLRSDAEGGYELLWQSLEAKGVVPSEHRSWSPSDPPYPGLRAFEEKDAPIFFGRDLETRKGVELLTRLQRQGHPRLAAVLGSSGSGKSSLVRAGIVPQLKRSDQDRWLVVGPFRPGHEPVRELAGALSKAYDEVAKPRDWEEIRQQLESTMTAPSKAAPSPASDLAAARAKVVQALETLEADLPALDREVVELLARLRSALAAGPSADSTPENSGEARSSPGADPLSNIADDLRLHRRRPDASVLLVVDQFEELLSADEEQADAAERFLELFAAALRANGSPLVAMITMRSDYLNALQQSTTLQNIEFKSLSVGPMSRDDMRKIIEEPARLGRITLEKGLTDLLLHDTGTVDALPLLAFALRLMWNRHRDMWDGHRDDRELEKREYKDLGGLRGAMAGVAEETFETARARCDEDALRKVFVRMARPLEGGGGWARRPLAQEKLPDLEREMLGLFVDKRLLVTRGEGQVEVAHEALFRSWERLRKWLDQSAEARYRLHEIETEARRWDDEDRSADFLWKGGRLARALELRTAGDLEDLTELDQDFLRASEEAQNAKRRKDEERRQQELARARELAESRRKQTRLAYLVAAVAFVALLLTAGLSWRAMRAQFEADVSLTKILLGDAVRWWDSGRMEEAKERLKGAHPYPRGRWDRLLGRKPEEVGDGFLAEFSPDGEILVTVSGDGAVKAWSVETEEITKQFEALEAVTAVAVSDPNGGADRLLALGLEGGRVDFRTLGGDSTSPDPIEGAESVALIEFNPGSPSVLAGLEESGVVKVWDAWSGNLLHSSPQTEQVTALALEPSWDGEPRLLATASQDGLARVWDFRDEGAETVELKHPGPVGSVAFDQDGRRVVTTSADHFARVWDISSRSEVKSMLHWPELVTASFQRVNEDEQVVSVARDNRVRRWDANPMARTLQCAVAARELRPSARLAAAQTTLEVGGHRAQLRDSPPPGRGRGSAEVIDFEQFLGPGIVEEVLSSGGTRVRVAGNIDASTENVALVFDTGDPPVPSLGAPNESFADGYPLGPGRGTGGRQGAPFENGRPLGKALALGRIRAGRAQPLRSATNCDLMSGRLTMDFSEVGSVKLLSMTFLDVADVRPAELLMLDEGGSIVYATEVPFTGDNGQVVLDLGPTEGVAQLVIETRGAIDNIYFQVPGPRIDIEKRAGVRENQ